MNSEQPPPPSTHGSEEQQLVPTLQPRLNLALFFTAMFAPTILTILMVQTGNKDAPPGIALVGGIISGIICGTLLGRRIGKTPQSKVGLAVALAFLLGAACILMNCFGCLATGYNVNFH